MKVLKFPLTKITFSFILGILLAYFLPVSIKFALFATILLALALSLSHYFKKKSNLTFAIQTYILSCFIGITTLLLHTESLQKSNYIHHKKIFKEAEFVTLTIREKLKTNDYYYRYIAHVDAIAEKPYSGRIILNIQRDTTAGSIIIGNVIRVKTTLQANSAPKNPNQFNYSNYLKDKQISAQIYAAKKDILVSTIVKKDIWYYAAKIHSRILSNLQKGNFGTTEMNVALALILGQRQEISSEIIKDYQFSGATHILSVSGLHVGFIMLFISFLLKPIPNTRNGSLFKLIIIISALFLFAILSGLSPSVLRSVVMFSFLAIGNQLRRSGNTYHTLIVSIFLILLFEPYFLFDIGFQLSYIALFFILWLQPLLKRIWTPKDKISSYVWEVLTVSFAAQIGTAPLCLYYFHQFPGLFFVTNVIVIPILTFIMIAGIIIMIVAFFCTPADFFIQIFEKSIYLLNTSIHYVASFESFVIRDISFNFYYLITFYVLVIFAIIWAKSPSYPKLIYMMTAISLLQISLILTKKEIESKQELIVYNIKGRTLLSERNGHNITLFSGENKDDSDSRNNILNSYAVANFGVVKSNEKIKNVHYFKGKKIAIIDRTGVYYERMQTGILLLTGSPKINLERVIQDLKPAIIVTDASNSYSVQQLWKQTCLKLKIPFHATREKGYYKLE